MTPEDLTCDELSRKWAEKDVAFSKLVGTPLICNDFATGEGQKNSLVRDVDLLAEKGLSDDSLLVRVYEHDDDMAVQLRFPLYRQSSFGQPSEKIDHSDRPTERSP